MFTFVSSYGLRHFFALKHQVEVQEKELLELESDVISLQKYKSELENGDYILDNAFQLGYINEGDKVYFYNYSQNVDNSSISPSYIQNQSKAIKVTENNKSNAFFLMVSVIVGLVLTLTFSVISKKKITN
jgi:alkaline phosphatase